MTEPDQDLTEALSAMVHNAVAEQQPVAIVGSGSKSFLLPAPSSSGARLLNTSEHRGILEYRPDELVLTARAGTSLKTIRQVLQRSAQMLPFEPPAFRSQGTLGGALAAGLAGSARPWQGSVRDAVLGVKLIDGNGQILSFGGSVVKNVAGYDVSRLQAGAFGTLGLILDVSVRVIPIPAAEQTRVLAMPADEALKLMRGLARRSLPLTGLCHVDGQLFIRLRGAESAVTSAAAELGGEILSNVDFWNRIDTHQHPFFQAPGALMRQQPPPATTLESNWSGLVEWGGARRWQWRNSEASSASADWTAFNRSYAYQQCTAPGSNALLGSYQQRLRDVFDPHRLFNPELSDADSST